MAEDSKLVIMDFDGTLVDGETIDILAELAGVEEEVARITEMAMKGELEFEEALKRRVRLLAGSPASLLYEAAKRLRPNPGVREFLATARELGAKVVVVSGGFTDVVEEFRRKLGLDEGYANEIMVKDGLLTGKVYGPVMSTDAKGRIMNVLCTRYGVRPSDVVAVGDGANDAPMLKRAGLSIGFRPKEILLDVVDHVVDHLGEAADLLTEHWGQ